MTRSVQSARRPALQPARGIARAAPLFVALLMSSPVWGANASGVHKSDTTAGDLPPGWEATYVHEPVFDSRMYVLEAGARDKPTVLLLHGLGATAGEDWHRVVAALDDDYRVVVPDLPGFGRSQVPATTLSPERYAAMLDWLIERLGLRPVHLVGHSMGGAITLYYASEHPGSVEQLIVADTAGILHRAAFIRTLMEARPDLNALPNGIRMSVRRLIDKGERLIERLATGPDPTEYLREESAAWRRLLSDRPNTNAALALIRSDFSGRLEHLEVPVTIIWGSADSVAPLRTAHLLDARLPNSRLEVIEGAGHVPMQTHPAAFLDILRPALRGAPVGDKRGREAPRQSSYRCADQIDQRVSGHFTRIVIESCIDVHLVDVVAEQVVIEDSLVEMTHVELCGPPAGAALTVRGSAVRATGLHVAGHPALRADAARMDLAGATLDAPEAAVEVERGSGFIFSVSELHSGMHTGYLHGMVEIAYGTLDGIEQIRSAAEADQLAGRDRPRQTSATPGGREPPCRGPSR